MAFKIGQIVYVAYISTEDKYHNLRHKIIWQECKLIRIAERAGEDKWYSVQVQLSQPFKHNGKIRKTFTIDKCQLQKITTAKKIEYSVFDDKRTNMLQHINDTLNLNNKPVKSTDIEFWKREFEAGIVLECKYENSDIDNWYDVRLKEDKDFMSNIQKNIDKGKYTRIIEFRYKD